MALCVCGNIVLVRHHHDGDSLLGKLGKKIHNLNRAFRIKVASGLICKKDRWIVHERTRNRNALLLPARKLAWRMHFAAL